MRALFGVLSLLLVLAIVGMVTVRQLRAVGHVASVPASGPEAVQVPRLSGSGSVRDQSQQLEHQVANDIAKAMNQGAASRAEEADKP